MTSTQPGIDAGARPSAHSTEASSPEDVRAMFNAIAPTYDRLNHLLSFGLDRLWWWRTARRFREVLARPEATVVDLCCGTGDLTAAMLKLRPTNATPLIGLDFSTEMLRRAEIKYPSANVRWVPGDALHLPFADSSVDLVTAAFGFRNLANYEAGLVEIARVLRPGGMVGILEANQPNGLRGLAYNLYFHRILPVVGGLLSGQRAAYAYLPASVARFPRPPQMLGMMATAGFDQPHWQPFLLHAAGLFTARKR